MWEEAKKRFPVGQRVHGTVTRHCPFGIFVDLGDPVAVGLVEIVNFLDAGRMTAEQYPPVGATITAVAIGHTDERRKQVWLSMRPSDLDQRKKVTAP
jgi:ribosomal protein S1